MHRPHGRSASHRRGLAMTGHYYYGPHASIIAEDPRHG
jgi:hypothetical protein